jgi:hypothetical protein
VRDLERLLRIAVPSVAAIVAGAGALFVLMDHPASSASRMAEAAEPAPSMARPCEQQTWPHIDRRCLSVAAEQPAAPRKIRLVTTDRLADLPVVAPPQPASAVAEDVVAAAPAPQPVTTPVMTKPVAQVPVMAMTEVHKPKPVRRTAKRERRRATATVQRTYEVPAYGDPHGTRRVTVTTQSRYEELFGPRF